MVQLVGCRTISRRDNGLLAHVEPDAPIGGLVRLIWIPCLLACDLSVNGQPTACTCSARICQSIGEYSNRHVLLSRKSFIVQPDVGDDEAAAAEMQETMERLQRVYLSRPRPSGARASDSR